MSAACGSSRRATRPAAVVAARQAPPRRRAPGAPPAPLLAWSFLGYVLAGVTRAMLNADGRGRVDPAPRPGPGRARDPERGDGAGRAHRGDLAPDGDAVGPPRADRDRGARVLGPAARGHRRRPARRRRPRSMVVIGVANATYDVALFTTIQRSTSNDDRAPVLSVMEGIIGLGAVAGGLLAPVLLFVFGTRGALVVAGPDPAGRRRGALPADRPSRARARRGRGARPPAARRADVRGAADDRGRAGRRGPPAVLGARRYGTHDPGRAGRPVPRDRDGRDRGRVDGQPIHRLGPGAGVGEIALLRRSPRTATVEAITDVAGYGIDAATFLAAVAGPAAMAVTERMAEANLVRAGAAD